MKPLLIGLVAVPLALGFAHLGIEVGEGDTLGFDLLFARGAQALRLAHPWVADVMRDWSGLGSTSVLVLFTAITVGYLALDASWATAAAVCVSTLAGTLLVSVFKDLFGRSRPGPALTDLVVSGPSFPSGHASMSAIVFLTLGTLLASTRVRHRERTYIVLVSALLALLVGVGRAVSEALAPCGHELADGRNVHQSPRPVVKQSKVTTGRARGTHIECGQLQLRMTRSKHATSPLREVNQPLCGCVDDGGA